jgi:hypothetical protein
MNDGATIVVHEQAPTTDGGCCAGGMDCMGATGAAAAGISETMISSIQIFFRDRHLRHTSYVPNSFSTPASCAMYKISSFLLLKTLFSSS